MGLVVAFSVAIAAWQLWVPNTHVHEPRFSSLANRAEALRLPPTFLPQSWNASNAYADRSLPIIATTAEFTFYQTFVEDDRFTAVVSLPAGLKPFSTNIAGGPYLVHVGGGVRVDGRNGDGFLVLQRTTDGSQPVLVELRTQLSAPVLLGRITTALSAALLLALAAIASVRRWRTRSARGNLALRVL